MFDNGNHVVLRRDGVAVVLKTPQNEMPQVEYWGRDFGVPSAEGELSTLDAMTLKVTPPAEKPDAALRPSLLPQGAEAFAGRPGLRHTAAPRRCSCAGPRSRRRWRTVAMSCSCMPRTPSTLWSSTCG